jgi:hypothetical protein
VTLRSVGEGGHLSSRRGNSLIEIFGQVDKIDPFCTFLAGLDPDQGDGNFTCADLLDQFVCVEMREIVSAHVLDRDNGLSTVLSQEKKSGVHVAVVLADPSEVAIRPKNAHHVEPQQRWMRDLAASAWERRIWPRRGTFTSDDVRNEVNQEVRNRKGTKCVRSSIPTF